MKQMGACLLATQVYAYTTSELQVAILKLFVRAECRLPNLFVGTLTRESVTQALEFGVQADQIVSFMQQHAHPHVLHKIPIVPEVNAKPSGPPDNILVLDALLWCCCPLVQQLSLLLCCKCHLIAQPFWC